MGAILMAEQLCPCGKPLHYSNPSTQALVERMISLLGPTIKVTRTQDGRTWRVPRHYIALHGLKEQDLPDLGFEEISN